MPELKHYVETTAATGRYKLLYQFSNFGRSPLLSCRKMIEQIKTRGSPKAVYFREVTTPDRSIRH